MPPTNVRECGMRVDSPRCDKECQKSVQRVCRNRLEIESSGGKMETIGGGVLADDEERE